MADLTGKNISDTYTRLVQVSESQLYDGAGGILPIQFDSENVIVSEHIGYTDGQEEELYEKVLKLVD